jgi:hypothetical protein
MAHYLVINELVGRRAVIIFQDKAEIDKHGIKGNWN